MTVKQLKEWCESIEDQDRKVPPEIVLAVLDPDLETRLSNLLSIIFVYAREPFASEAMAMLVKLQIPE